MSEFAFSVVIPIDGSHRLYIKMDDTSKLPTTIQEWSLNVLDTNAAILEPASAQ